MIEKSDIAIKVDNVSKTFQLPHEKQTSLKSTALNAFKKKTIEKQKALHNVSFEIKKGEFFGIVGRNGSGKSTLLKCMAGVYTPNSGGVKINGMLVPFIELGVGFNPELSGRDNVFLNGALLGFSRKQMNALYDDIVEFAELEQFMDQKLKNYSSGMQVRLAFSIAIRAKGDVLLLDEVLAVGDSAFQKKCTDYFEELKNSNRTVILVTHSMDSVKRFCNRAMLLDSGEVKAIGEPNDIANEYTLDNLNAQTKSKKSKEKNKHLTDAVDQLVVKPLSSLNPSSDDAFVFEITYVLNQDIEVDVGIAFAYNGQSVIEHNTKEFLLGHRPGKRYKIRYSLPLKPFLAKTLRLDVAIFERKGFQLIGYHTNCLTLTIIRDSTDRVGGLLYQRGKWELVNEKN